MKGEQQEERVPNFIGNAVIILTASHLGCEVEMLATAQEVWRTKRLRRYCWACTKRPHAMPCRLSGREVWRNRLTVSERYFTGRGNFPRRKKTIHKKE